MGRIRWARVTPEVTYGPLALRRPEASANAIARCPPRSAMLALVRRALAVSTRPFRVSDENFVLTLSAEAFGEYAKEGARSTLEMAKRWTCLVAEIPGVVPAPTAATLATRRAPARAVGFVVLKAERGELAEILAIAVVEEERGRGFGRALLEAAEQKARAARTSGVMLHTADANLAALELFVRSGFRVKRRIARYYRNVYDASEMLKNW